MAFKKGSISQTTKSQKKKLEKIKNTEIELIINELDDNQVVVNINMNSIIEPYVRNRLAGNSSHLYDPLNTYKKQIRRKLKEQLENYENFKMGEGKITFIIDVYTVPPKSFTKRQLVYAIFKRIIRPIVKPDLDNVAKTAMDVCSKLFWKDDNQVVELKVRKFYGENQATYIKFYMDLKPDEIRGIATTAYDD